MGNIWDEIANDAPKILAEVGREVEFRGKKILVLLDTNPLSQDIGDGGFIYSSGFRVRMLALKGSDYQLNPPKQGERMAIYDRSHTIKRVTQRYPDPWIDVYVINTNQ